MRIPIQERVLSWAVPVVLAVVLIGLAFLQYRWSGQVSEAASTRMRAGLQTSLLNFREDLERELGTMALEMQLEAGKPVEAPGLAERTQLWETTSAQSGLIANVYWWNRSGLFRLSMTERKFSAAAWPKRFASVQSTLNGSFLVRPPHDETQRGEAAPAGQPHGPAHRPMAMIDQSIPVLIFPAAQSGDAGLLLVELNKSVLRDSVLPRLVERNFGNPRSSEYEVSVIEASDSNSEVIYSSVLGETISGAEVDADASLNLFGPPTSARQPGHVASPANREIFPVVMPQSESGAGPDFFSFMRFDPMRDSTDNAEYEITARHRKGSVEAAVADLRRRSLGLSFGVLLVLAASISLILFNAQRARRLAALQMDFVAGVSHELRTPVAAILSASENIADGLVNDRQQVIRYGALIKNQARQLNHLVEQVLRFAATRKNMVAYDIRPFALRTVIEGVLQTTAGVVEAAGCRIDTQIAADLPPVAADAGVLSQCLQNLITNAVKYGGESKWIGVRAFLDGPRNHILVTVEDRGIGIDPSEIHQIFQPFYRSQSVMSSHVHGTGLGLSLARSFAEAMGGRLWVESEVGKGTVFTLSLPLAVLADSSQTLSSPHS
jgi:signal transduction histidine kinase